MPQATVPDSTSIAPSPRVAAAVLAGFALFFLLLLLPLPLHRSIMGSTDTLLGVGLSDSYSNAIAAKVTGMPLGRAMYPAEPARFGEAGVGAAGIFMLYRALGMDDVWALFLFQATLLTLTALATFLVAREYIGRAAPAVFAAVAFATSNFMWSNIDDLPIHFYCFPLLALFYLKRAINSGRGADAWRGAVLGGAQAYFSFQVFAYQSLLLGIVALCNIGTIRQHFSWRRLWPVLGTYLLLPLPVLTFYLISALHLHALDMWTDPGSLALYRLHLTDLITQLPHKLITYPFVTVLSRPQNVMHAWNWGLVRDSAFIGLLIPLLGMIGLASRPRVAIELLLIGLVGLFLALGRVIEVGDHRITSPLQYVYDLVPLLSYVRVTLRSFALTVFAMSVLAGLGLCRLLTRRGTRPVVQFAGVAAATLFVLGENVSWPLNPGEIIPYPEAPSGYVDFFKSRPNAVILDLPSTSTSWPGYVDDIVYLLWQTKHRRSILGGVNGYYPASRLETQTYTDQLPSPASLQYFRSVGLTHFVVHDSPYLRQLHEPTTFAPTLTPGQVLPPQSRPGGWLDSSSATRLVFADSEVRIYELASSRRSPSRPLQPDILTGAVTRGARYLASVQQADGGFPSVLCFDAAAEQCRPDANVFTDASIALSLDFVDGAPALILAQVKRRLLQHLASVQDTATGYWRTYAGLLAGYGHYPADLDVTSLAADVLTRTGATFRDPLSRLIALQNANGLFPTWLETSSVRTEDLFKLFDATLPPRIATRLKQQTHWDPSEPPDCAVNANFLNYAAARRHVIPTLCSAVVSTCHGGSVPIV